MKKKIGSEKQRTLSSQEQFVASWEKHDPAGQNLDIFIDNIKQLRGRGSAADVSAFLKDWGELVSSVQRRLLDEYFQVAEEVRGKRKLGTLQRRQCLKRLVTPLVKYSQLQPVDNPFIRPDGTFPFVSESIYVKDEIPIKQIHYNQDRYIIDIDRGVLNPDEECITIIRERDEYIEERKKRSPDSTFRSLGDLPRRHSLRELYEGWIGKVNQETMKSKDLLDQLLIVFAIKRALNGEERTIKKLYELYIKTATAVAHKMAKHYYDMTYDSSEIESIAQASLKSILIGFNPRTIMNNLTDPDSFLPLWMEKLCIYYFSRYVPDELNKLLKASNENAAGIQIMTLLYPSSFFNDTVRWRGTPKRIMRLNNMSFRPRKKGNLTTWLFGAKKGPKAHMNGRFCQLIHEAFKRCEHEKKETISIAEYEDHDDGSVESGEDIMDRIKQEGPIECGVMAETQDPFERLELDDVIETLTRKGLLSRRDADIYLNPDEYNKTELAKVHHLSRRHIYRIYEKVESLIKILDK